MMSLQDYYLISYDDIPLNLNDICVHKEGLHLTTGKYILY